MSLVDDELDAALARAERLSLEWEGLEPAQREEQAGGAVDRERRHER